MSESKTEQLPFVVKEGPKPTGNMWEPSKSRPASVPVPLPVVMVRVEGPFTALDRKLWLLLLHNAWDELDSDKPYHEVAVSDLLRLFRKFGRGDLGKRGRIKVGKDAYEETEAAALWDSVRRLARTSVEWEDENYRAVSSLLPTALLQKRYREAGKMYYSFGKVLATNILAPHAFARLRTHVVMALRSKYAVTLYEILEAYVNRRETGFTVSIPEFRSWLKVPDEAYREWKDLKRNVLLPAINEINEQGEEGGFFIAYEGIREGKSYAQIRFTLTKTAERDDRDMLLQDKARRGRAYAYAAPPMAAAAPTSSLYEPTDAVLDQLARIAPGWDRQALLARFREWTQGKPTPKNPHGAFVGWAKRVTKGKAP
ncbi:replication initiation protein [Roseomonas mucosa]|uniref:replication initiation protein n=1 Tax=Roseomonas mucosa TaxID=207340 RepID=UPI0022474D6A|nr:replication initiation protein [Roseomonas mucosa]UZO94927.1 Hypothetical protein RMP42_05928 [Roseomonas mucosa]